MIQLVKSPLYILSLPDVGQDSKHISGKLATVIANIICILD